ncbi:MAG: hypothetical protein M1305_06410 [Candidatus Marsarchaeota archaeon]|nr:hypothetical protein [Candidatus Marsarchaeota archaeon]
MEKGFERMVVMNYEEIGVAHSRGRASRTHSGKSVRLGLLNNGKPNAEKLLQAFGYRLADRIRISVVRTFEKPDFGESVDENVVVQIQDACDVVIAGVGD